jgi:hypothetical protein
VAHPKCLTDEINVKLDQLIGPSTDNDLRTLATYA